MIKCCAALARGAGTEEMMRTGALLVISSVLVLLASAARNFFMNTNQLAVLWHTHTLLRCMFWVHVNKVCMKRLVEGFVSFSPWGIMGKRCR